MPWRSLVRALPYTTSEIRAELADILAKPNSPSKANGLLTEATFLLGAQRHLEVLNAKYFPQSQKSQQEVLEATAARVGVRVPDKTES